MKAAASVVLRANALTLAAAEKIDAALADLARAARLLESSPEFLVTVRLRRARRPESECLTLPWYRHSSIRSIVEEIPLADAARLLRDDVERDAFNMADAIADEQAVLGRYTAAAA